MKKLTIAAGALLCAATAIPSFAQEAAPGAAPQASYTDEQLKGFAQAAVKVQIISQQARTQMMQAVESVEGLDMDTYNSIVQQAQTDETLSAKISQYMQEYADDSGIATTPGPQSQGQAE